MHHKKPRIYGRSSGKYQQLILKEGCIFRMIDKHAIIHPSAQIASDVSIGPWSVIGSGVVIGSQTDIAAHVVIGNNTVIGKNNKIYPYASVGSDPQHLHYRGEQASLMIGDHNVIREFVTINSGMPPDACGVPDACGMTTIGNYNYFMAYTHVAHDCVIGNHVTFVNLAAIAGHVRIDDYAILSYATGVHQFCRVGAYAFLGRAAKVVQDVLPYMLIIGSPGAPIGINRVGLKRHGFSSEVMNALKRAHQLIHRRDLRILDICLGLEKLAVETPEIHRLVEMIKTSSRGFARNFNRPNKERVIEKEELDML
jgi:UDP-N-acetylglucosamine acyltransferase